MAKLRIPHFLGAAAVLSALGLGPVPGAAADGSACANLSVSVKGAAALSNGLVLLQSHKLYREQIRPWAHIPTGAALLVRAPAHTTLVDLHNALALCAQKAEPSSPFCVPGASFSVHAEGGNYVIQITSNDRKTAREIQHRIERLGV
jgi:hypothetical protein